MPRRLLAVNVVLAGAALICVGLIVKQFAGSRPVVTTRSRPPATTLAPPGPSAESPRPPAQAYNAIAARNLFSPTRTESSVAATGSGPALNVVKPNLHGVVLRDGAPIAYLEDPLTKRTAGYRIGDPIAGGTVQTISADTVVIARPDGSVDVRLRDPSKPRPPAPAPAGQPPGPGQQPAAGQPPVTGQPLPPGSQPIPAPIGPTPRAFTPPPPQSLQPGQPAPGVVNPMPFGRPAPSLGRRLPPTPAGPQQPAN
jgi:hypothetical protein